MGKYNSSWIERNVYYAETVGEHEGKPIPHFNQYERPVIVCLCGSTKFKEAYVKAQADETIAGKIVLSVGLFGHLEGLDMSGELKQQLDELHKRKVDLADEILVINVGGYVGESTMSEIKHALKSGKTIRWLEPDKAIKKELFKL